MDNVRELAKLIHRSWCTNPVCDANFANELDYNQARYLLDHGVTLDV